MNLSRTHVAIFLLDLVLKLFFCEVLAGMGLLNRSNNSSIPDDVVNEQSLHDTRRDPVEPWATQ